MAYIQFFMLEKANTNTNTSRDRAKYFVKFGAFIRTRVFCALLIWVLSDKWWCWIIAEKIQRDIKLFRSNWITANICALPNMGLDLQLSLSLDGLLMAIIAAACGPKSNIRPSLWLESNPVPEVAPKSFYLTWISHSITQHSLWGQ